MACVAASAAPPQVTGVTASQQAGTKLVDVDYNLVLDGGQTAFVELWFSPDNGLTYPVACHAISGDVNASVTGGSKTAVWNAGEDWDHQFTQNGKIRVIATYGSEPSGFAGSGGSGGGDPGDSGQGDASLEEVFWDVFYALDHGGAPGTWEDQTDWFQGLTKMLVDPTEITNEKWNEVAQWALGNGYSGLPVAPGSAVADEPRTDITFWEAVKWCNARSEMDGLDPVYYADYSEGGWDQNGNGIVDSGTDTFESWNPGADLNGNGQWDPGEPFTDNPPITGTFDPMEYEDYNGNNAYDEGHTQVFRSGAEISLAVSGGGGGGGGATPMFWNCIDNHASGYHLPPPEIFQKLATGGLSQKFWPWGDETPENHANFANEYVATRYDSFGTPIGTPLTQATSADGRTANGYGLKDIIGNVAEWTESLYDNGMGVMQGTVYGGSYLGLGFADEGAPTTLFNTTGGLPAGTPTSLFEATLEGLATSSSPAVGMRCVRMIWSTP